jgi:hypothetical protein
VLEITSGTEKNMRFAQIFNKGSARDHRAKRNLSISVDSLEGRALLGGGGPGYGGGGGGGGGGSGSGGGSIGGGSTILTPTLGPTTPIANPIHVNPVSGPANPFNPIAGPTPNTPPPARAPKAVRDAQFDGLHKATGVVAKAPHFYEFYTGPKSAELNAVKASAELSPQGIFTFTGTNQGAIKKGPAVYVWGVDRNGNLPPGPFTDRPNIKFDAVVVVSLSSTLTPSAEVVDLASGTTTALPASAVNIQGHTVSVKLSASLLPSTGLAPSQYRFNFWPEDGGPPVSASVASFVPEFTTAQVGTK